MGAGSVAMGRLLKNMSENIIQIGKNQAVIKKELMIENNRRNDQYAELVQRLTRQEERMLDMDRRMDIQVQSIDRANKGIDKVAEHSKIIIFVCDMLKAFNPFYKKNDT